MRIFFCKSIRLIPLTVFVSFFVTINSSAQVTEEWVARYNGPPGDRLDLASGMIVDSGNVYVSGISAGIGSLNDIVLLKYDSIGNLLWEFRYNGPGNLTDDSRDLILTPDNCLAITGITSYQGSVVKMVTIKIDKNGDTLWTRIFDDPKFNFTAGNKIVSDSFGNLYIAGSARGTSGFQDILIVKYSSSGEFQWQYIFSGTGNRDDFAIEIIANELNEIYVTGTTQMDLSRHDILLTKLSTSGNLIWQKTYNGPNSLYDGATAAAIDSHGNIYITGRTTAANLHSDILLLKYNPQSELLWVKTFNGPGDNIDIPFDISIDHTDHILITGYVRTGQTLGSEDVVTLKYNDNGDLIWSRIFNGNGNGSDQGICITTDSEGSVYVGGAMDTGNFKMIYLVMKYSSEGELLWFRNYQHFTNPEDFVYFIHVDEVKNIYISGISFGGETDYDIATIKYSQTVGINQISGNIPDNFKLYQNFPNPYNPVTNIKFAVNRPGELTIYISDINGKLLNKMNSRIFVAGVYQTQIDMSQRSSGTYFISVEMNGERQTIKSILTK